MRVKSLKIKQIAAWSLEVRNLLSEGPEPGLQQPEQTVGNAGIVPAWFHRTRRKDMTKWLKVVAYATLALVCSVAVVQAQEQTGSIEGVVHDKDGKALPGVTIEATGPAGTLVAVTDANGRYRLPRVPLGSYVI
jgi:uncharacterized membrane protein YdfJ with MMPL/SSD domain